MGGGLGGAGGGGGGSGSGQPADTCSDAQAWTAPPAPAACAGTAPAASGAAEVTLAVDAGASLGAWNRFYERAVAADHAHTFLCTKYGRNIQNALRKAHAQAGFQYVRFHGIFNDDVGVYKEDASGAPLYDWSGPDAIYDAIIAAGMRPMVEISFTPPALASDATKVQTLLWYNGRSPNISPPTGSTGEWNKWQMLMMEFVRHLEDRYGAEEVRNNWYFEVWNEPSWMYSLGDTGYYELYKNTVTGLLLADRKTMESFRFWQVGTVAGRGTDVLLAGLPFLLLGAVLALAGARLLNTLALGDDLARGLGRRTTRDRLVMALAIVLLAGTATALAGPIAFVGLVVPHVVRALVGPDLVHWGKDDDKARPPYKWDTLFLLDNESREKSAGEIWIAAPTLIE